MSENAPPPTSRSNGNSNGTTEAAPTPATGTTGAANTSSGTANNNTNSTNNGANNNNNNNTTTTTNQPGTGPGTNRGLPYYEKLRRELRDTLQRKRLMDKSMVFSPGTWFYSLTQAADQSNKGPTRRPNFPLRTIIPRRNHRRKHHQRLRQLHQGLVDGLFTSWRDWSHGFWDRRCRRCSRGWCRGRRRKTEGPGLGFGPCVFEEFCQFYAGMFCVFSFSLGSWF